MNEFQATAVMVGLFALRCVLPIALTIGIGYMMNRLVDRWDAADAAAEAIPVPAPRSIPVLAVQNKLPCWVLRNCDEAKRAACPASSGTLVCWLARLRVEGTLPADCADCQIYEGQPGSLAMGD